MGNSAVKSFIINDNANRTWFVRFKNRRNVRARFGSYVVFTYTIRYQRYKWDIEFRYNDLVRLDRVLVTKFDEQLQQLQRPSKYNKLFFTHDERFLQDRVQMMCKYLQELLDIEETTENHSLRSFLNISKASFNPNMGRKGKEGFLSVCSGGYVEKFSRTIGDFFHHWTTVWMVLHDTCIAWYSSPSTDIPKGILQLDKDFRIKVVGRVITIFTETRHLLLTAPTTRSAEEWESAMREFYNNSTRTTPHFFESAFPPRADCDVRVYTITRDYFNSLAISMLSAQKEILICSWKNSPTTILTRPPYPTIRLDQILKYKAEQGVKIFVLLYKEVEGIGQSNDSLRTKTYLEGLNANIHCIRHPNKFMGGSTAVLWSHHEKTVVIDRNLCFVGGVDLAFTRWDDDKHRVADEEGIWFPGMDYRNPAPGVHKPQRTEPADGSNDDEEEEDLIEVEIALPGEALPTAATATVDGMDGGDAPYEVEVVVDFGVGGGASNAAFAPLTAASLAATGAGSAGSANGANGGSSAGGAAAGSRIGGNSKPPPVTRPGGPFGSPSASKPRTVSAAPSKATVVGAATAPVATAGVKSGSGDMMVEDNSDNMSEVSENWAEDRFQEETAEERQAKEEALGAMRKDDASEMGESVTSRGSSFFSDFTASVASSKRSMGQYLRSKLQSVTEHYNSRVTTKRADTLEPRDLYPRMGWHDLQASVTGLVARDIASHFVQRWNHHRLSAAQYAQPVMYDITDQETFGICAKCEATAINEAITLCPNCGHSLGSGNSYTVRTDPAKYPVLIDEFSFLSFQCTFPGKTPLPFRMLGDSPVVVTALIHQSSSSSPPPPPTSKVPPSRLSVATMAASDIDLMEEFDGAGVSGESYVGAGGGAGTGANGGIISSSSSNSNSGFATYSSGSAITTAATATAAATWETTTGSEEGLLVELQGEHSEWLHSFGLKPAVGDVVVSIDGDIVTHLNSNQVNKIVKKKRKKFRADLAAQARASNGGGEVYANDDDEPIITVTFRRHYLENLNPAENDPDNKEIKNKEDSLKSTTTQSSSSAVLPPVPPSTPSSPPPLEPSPTAPTAGKVGGNHILSEAEMQALEAEERAGDMKLGKNDDEAMDSDPMAFAAPPMKGFAPTAPAPAAVMQVDEEVTFGKGGASAPSSSSSTGTGGGGGGGGAEGEAHPTAVAAVPMTSGPISLHAASADSSSSSSPTPAALSASASASASASGYISNMFATNASKVSQFHPACQAAAQAEVRLAMSRMFHTFYPNVEVPRRLTDGSGTCRVQLLRSIGKWSTGTPTECSIQNCYVESIRNSKHFVYIENQFFVGSTAGDKVANSIPGALVERIILAHNNRQAFRVIVIIPVHPNGDFVHASKSKVVMHFEYATINRGANSMFEQLKRRAPGIVISDYIEFFSLRNWGVINNRVVSEQVYVHDKLLIVDDRVLVIGSANINDRSMCGDRDSELAVRIEDTIHAPAVMGDAPFTVGFLPHSLRLRLMRQHLGVDESVDLSDPLNHRSRELWRKCANTNSALYDSLDGNTSVYRVTRIADFKAAFETYVNPSYLDPEVQHTCSEIKGFLVDWPKSLFEKEDLSPSLATRAIVPNELWV